MGIHFLVIKEVESMVVIKDIWVIEIHFLVIKFFKEDI